MKVLFDDQIFALQQFGGISRYFCEIAPRLDCIEGLDVRIVGGVHYNDHLRGCKVRQRSLHVPLLSPRLARFYRAANRLAVPLIIRSEAPAIFHQTYYNEARRLPGVPNVVTVYDMIHERFPQTFDAERATAMKRRITSEAARVICISQSTAEDLVHFFDVPRQKIAVVHLAASEHFFDRPAVAEPPVHPRPFVLFVGHRGGYKNFSGLVHAYGRSRVSRDIDLLLIGGSKLSSAELEEIGRAGVRADAVHHLAGSDVLLARAYRQARAFVYPSLYEGFGIPPLEAMASNCPVACSRSSSLPEVVDDAALLFDGASSDEIGAALEAMCFDEQVRARLIAAGARRARYFSWDRCAAETARVYRAL